MDAVFHALGSLAVLADITGMASVWSSSARGSPCAKLQQEQDPERHAGLSRIARLLEEHAALREDLTPEHAALPPGARACTPRWRCGDPGR